MATGSASSGAADGGTRQAEAFDLAGLGREHVMDALAANLATPVATDPHLLRFPTEGPWVRETHRLCQIAPGALERLLEEVAVAGVEQVLVLSAAPPPGRPHELSSARGDFLAGGQRSSSPGSRPPICATPWSAPPAGSPAFYVIRPAHNPVGLLDFGGAYDERSDRHFSLAELVDRGYEDAFDQFIEPVVAASGERIVTVQS